MSNSLPGWVQKVKACRHQHPAACAEVDLVKALEIALEALDKIEKRKLEDLPNDKKKDEFHKTLMAFAAWTYCSFTANEALRRIREVGR